MRTAHIVTRPHEVGDRVLALCDKEYKVKTLWDDIPDDNPICRRCLDTAINALDEADEVIQRARRIGLRLTMAAQVLTEYIDPEVGLILDGIAEAADDFESRQAEKRQAKDERQKTRQTCTCTWTDHEKRDTNPDCPVHGHGPDDEPPVAPELQEN